MAGLEQPDLYDDMRRLHCGAVAYATVPPDTTRREMGEMNCNGHDHSFPI